MHWLLQTDSVGRALLPFVRQGDMRVMLISVGPRSCDELPGGGAGQSCRETSEGRPLQGLDCRQDRETERRKLQSEASAVGQTVFAFQWPCMVLEDGGQELVEKAGKLRLKNSASPFRSPSLFSWSPAPLRAPWLLNALVILHPASSSPWLMSNLGSHLDSLRNLNSLIGCWGNGSAVRRLDCSSRLAQFGSQYPQGVPNHL